MSTSGYRVGSGHPGAEMEGAFAGMTATGTLEIGIDGAVQSVRCSERLSVCLLTCFPRKRGEGCGCLRFGMSAVGLREVAARWGAVGEGAAVVVANSAAT